MRGGLRTRLRRGPCTAIASLVALVFDLFACLPLEMQVRPPNTALFIGEYMSGAKLDAEAPSFLIKLDRDHIKVEVVPEDNLLK